MMYLAGSNTSEEIPLAARTDRTMVSRRFRTTILLRTPAIADDTIRFGTSPRPRPNNRTAKVAGQEIPKATTSVRCLRRPISAITLFCRSAEISSATLTPTVCARFATNSLDQNGSNQPTNRTLPRIEHPNP